MIWVISDQGNTRILKPAKAGAFCVAPGFNPGDAFDGWAAADVVRWISLLGPCQAYLKPIRDPR